MPKLSKNDLKARFTSGRVPSQDDWYALIDSMVHKDEQVAVDQQVVNTKISAYDTSLKSQQTDGTVNTLGDVFKIFSGFNDNRTVNNELSWPGLPGRPASINLAWTEQTIVTDSTTYNPLGAGGSPGSGPMQRWLGSTVAGLTGNYIVTDMKCERRWISTGTETGFYTDEVVAAKVAIQPKINLQ